MRFAYYIQLKPEFCRGKIFIHLIIWPGASFEQSGIKETVERAYLPADPKHKALAIKKNGNMITVTLPEKAPDPYDSVLCLIVKGATR